MVKSRQVDQKRRVILPHDFKPGTDVLMEQVDEESWLITRYHKQTKLKIVKLPVLTRLPDDLEWDKVERAFAQAAVKTIHPPEFD